MKVPRTAPSTFSRTHYPTRRRVPWCAVAMWCCVAMLCAYRAGAGTVGIGDLLRVNVSRHPELSTTAQVDGNGNIAIPYAGNVAVAGLSESEAASRVTSALGSVLRNPSATVTRTPRTATVESRRTAEMRTELVSLSNTQAQGLSDALQGMSSEGGAVSYHADSNMLIITDTPAAIDNMKQVIQQLDDAQTQRTQVRVEAKIVEAQIGAMKELGIRWFGQGSEAGGGYYPLGSQTSGIQALRGSAGSPSANETIGTSNNLTGTGGGRRFIETQEMDRRMQIPIHVPTVGQLFFGFLNEDIDLTILIDALVADNRAEILANPYTLTTNHNKAEIRMGKEYPYTEFGTEVSGRANFSTKFMDLGIVLDVTPHVYEDPTGAYVQLDLIPEVSFVAGSSNGVPIRAVRRADTTANVRDGQTLAVGGIYLNDTHNVKQRVPIVGSVPLLGNLFKRTERTTTSNELMVFVTPTIHDTPESVTWDRMVNLTSVKDAGVPAMSSDAETDGKTARRRKGD